MNIHVGFQRVLWFLPTTQKHANRWIDYTELPLGVNVCAQCRAMDWFP